MASRHLILIPVLLCAGCAAGRQCRPVPSAMYCGWTPTYAVCGPSTRCGEADVATCKETKDRTIVKPGLTSKWVPDGCGGKKLVWQNSATTATAPIRPLLKGHFGSIVKYGHLDAPEGFGADSEKLFDPLRHAVTDAGVNQWSACIEDGAPITRGMDDVGIFEISAYFEAGRIKIEVVSLITGEDKETHTEAVRDSVRTNLTKYLSAGV